MIDFFHWSYIYLWRRHKSWKTINSAYKSTFNFSCNITSNFFLCFKNFFHFFPSDHSFSFFSWYDYFTFKTFYSFQINFNYRANFKLFKLFIMFEFLHRNHAFHFRLTVNYNEIFSDFCYSCFNDFVLF